MYFQKSALICNKCPAKKKQVSLWSQTVTLFIKKKNLQILSIFWKVFRDKVVLIFIYVIKKIFIQNMNRHNCLFIRWRRIRKQISHKKNLYWCTVKGTNRIQTQALQTRMFTDSLSIILPLAHPCVLWMDILKIVSIDMIIELGLITLIGRKSRIHNVLFHVKWVKFAWISICWTIVLVLPF